MIKRILYGYQIQNGELTIHPKESENVKRIFSFYLAGMTQRQIADVLNDQGICSSLEHPAWTQQRISTILHDPHYTGKDRHPILVDNKMFDMAQELMAKKAQKRRDHPALCLVKKLRCGNCGHSLRRIIERHCKYALRFHCDGCGMSVTIPDADILAEVERQAAEYIPPQAEGGYTPSEDAVRLTNAINRGLEKPEQPEDVVALIMQGISARYACFPTQMTSADLLHLIKEKDYDQAIQYITITADNAVTVTFK